MRLDAYTLTAQSIVTLAPAPARRAWMERTPERFANRCLPLMMANQAGWVISLTEPVEVVWSGRDGHGEVEVHGSERVRENVASHFGCPCPAPSSDRGTGKSATATATPTES